MRSDLDTWLDELQHIAQQGSMAAVAEVLKATVRQSTTKLFGEPRRAGITPLLVESDLTVLRLVWGPGMTLPPHNHNMWAAIGIEIGAEVNRFFREREGVLQALGGKDLRAGDVITLGRTVIHSVTNPASKYSS